MLRMEVADDVLMRSVHDTGCGAAARSFEAATAYGVIGRRERAGIAVENSTFQA